MAIIEIKAEGLLKNLFEAFGNVFKTKKGAQQAVIDSTVIRNIAVDIVLNGAMNVDCFLIMMVHNGGKKLSPITFKYRSMVNGHHNETQMPNFEPEEYRYLELDAYAENVMVDMIRYGEVDKIVRDMPDSKISVKLKFERLEYVKFMHLYSDKNAIWYVLVGTTQANERFNTVTQKNLLHLAVSKIRNMVKKY